MDFHDYDWRESPDHAKLKSGHVQWETIRVNAGNYGFRFAVCFGQSSRRESLSHIHLQIVYIYSIYLVTNEQTQWLSKSFVCGFRPEVEVRPTMGQIDDILGEEINAHVEKKNERTLATDQENAGLTDYFKEMGIKVK